MFDIPRGFLAVIIVAIVFLWLAYVSSLKHRQPTRACRACGATHPPFAQFCPRCGQKL